MSQLRRSTSRLVGMRKVGWRRSEVTVDYPDGAILHFDADIDAYAEQTGGPHAFNHAVLSPQYQRGADGSYANVGARPAVDTFDSKKWLRSCGAVQNLLTNSIFDGAVSGTPGTAPTGWTNRLSGGAPSTVFNGVSATYIGNGGYITDYLTFSASANTTYLFAADIFFDGVVSINRAINIANPPSGAAVSFLVDDVEVALDTVPAAGFRRAAAKIVIGATSGSPQARIGCGVNTANTTGQVTISNPQLTATSYPRPYVPTTAAGPVTQPASNATTTNGMWFSLPDGSPLWQALTGSPLTLATRVRMGVGSGDLLGNGSTQKILAINETGQQFYYFRGDVSTESKSKPISSTPDLVVWAEKSGTWQRNAIIYRVVQVSSTGLRFRAGYMIEGVHTTMQWSHTGDESTWPAFDGSFNPSTLYRLTLGYNNAYPMWFNKITAWKEQVSDARILEAMA